MPSPTLVVDRHTSPFRTLPRQTSLSAMPAKVSPSSGPALTTLPLTTPPHHIPAPTTPSGPTDPPHQSHSHPTPPGQMTHATVSPALHADQPPSSSQLTPQSTLPTARGTCPALTEASRKSSEGEPSFPPPTTSLSGPGPYTPRVTVFLWTRGELEGPWAPLWVPLGDSSLGSRDLPESRPGQGET